MNNIIATIESFKRKMFTGSVSLELIANAENELGTSIAPEYKEVLTKYGSLCVKGEEFLEFRTAKVNFFHISLMVSCRM